MDIDALTTFAELKTGTPEERRRPTLATATATERRQPANIKQFFSTPIYQSQQHQQQHQPTANQQDEPTTANRTHAIPMPTSAQHNHNHHQRQPNPQRVLVPPHPKSSSNPTPRDVCKNARNNRPHNLQPALVESKRLPHTAEIPARERPAKKTLQHHLSSNDHVAIAAQLQHSLHIAAPFRSSYSSEEIPPLD